MLIEGFKAFNSDLTNRYGFTFEEGKAYHSKGIIKYGNDGNGYHFCLNLEDTLRYFDGFNKDIKIAEVIGFNEIVTSFDEYYEYYNLYCASSIFIKHILLREEIINYMLDKGLFRVDRFLKGLKLTKEELVLFKEKYKSEEIILGTISYYQENNHNTYKRKLIL